MEIVLNSSKIEKILEKGLSIDFYILLNLLKNNEKDLAERKWSDFTDLIISGWITVGKTLTPKTVKFLEELEGVDWDNKAKENLEQLSKYQQLYSILQKKMIQLTGKQQKLIQNKYYFMPSFIDFQSRLSKVVKKYKLSDWNKVERVLIAYICRANKARFEMMPLLKYYIEKDGESSLSADYQDFVEKEQEINSFKSQQKFV